MSTGYSWQVRATLLGARHVPERLCGGYVYLGRYIKCSTFTFFTRGSSAIAEPLVPKSNSHFAATSSARFRSSLRCVRN